MNRIVEVTIKTDMIVNIQFSDGFDADLDVRQFIKGGVSEKLNNPEVFKQVHVDEFGGITWPTGFDFCPNFLREYLQPKNIH